MTNNGWNNIAEDILFILLRMIDKEDSSDICDQCDLVWRAYETYSWWRVKYTRKPGIHAVRQICSNWRSTAIATKEHYPLWMTTLHWADWAVQHNSSKYAESLQIAMIKHFEDTDVGVWARFSGPHAIHFIHSMVLAPNASKLRFLRFNLTFHNSKTISLRENFPRLSSFGYVGDDSAVSFEQAVFKLERLEVLPVTIENVPIELSNQFRSLQRLELSFRQGDRQPIFDFMEMSLLSSLVLHCVNTNLALYVLTFLSAPNLLSLELSNTLSSLSGPSLAKDFTMPRRKFPCLTTLDLSYFPIYLTLKLVNLLECPTLIHLGFAIVDEVIHHEYGLGDDIQGRTALSVTSFTLRTPDRFTEPPMNDQALMAVMRRILASIRMPHVKHFLLGTPGMTIPKCLPFANLFDKVETITVHIGGLNCFWFSLPAQGHSSSLLKACDESAGAPQAVTELGVEVSPYGGTHDWVRIHGVERMTVVGCDLEHHREVEAAVEFIQLLSNRISTPELLNRHAQWTTYLDWYMRRAKGFVQSLIQRKLKERTFLYPELRSLAFHACNHQPGAVLSKSIAEALKVFVKDRQKAGAVPLELHLRPPLEDRDINWFKKHGVNCVFTTGRDNERMRLDERLIHRICVQ